MTAMRKWILVIAVFALGWETGWSAKPEDLGNRERIDLNPAVARLSGHGENLEVDTTRLDGEWNWMLRQNKSCCPIIAKLFWRKVTKCPPPARCSLAPEKKVHISLSTAEHTQLPET